jgi:hypothetical protein
MGWKPPNREFHWDIITRSTNWMGRDQSFSLLVSMGLSTHQLFFLVEYLRLAMDTGKCVQRTCAIAWYIWSFTAADW